MPTLIKITSSVTHSNATYAHEDQWLAEEMVAMTFSDGQPCGPGDDEPATDVHLHVTLRNGHDVYMAWPWAERDKALEAKAEVGRLWAAARGDEPVAEAGQWLAAYHTADSIIAGDTEHTAEDLKHLARMYIKAGGTVDAQEQE